MNRIIHSCKAILRHKNQTLEKISSNQLFNVSMGSFNRAETCNLIGLLLLNEIKKVRLLLIMGSDYIYKNMNYEYVINKIFLVLKSTQDGARGSILT